MMFDPRTAAIATEATAWRHDIHAHPEMVFDVHRTAALVADRLAEFGFDEIVTGIGRTGVVGVLHGRSDTRGRVIAVRADMDALPITEATNVAHSSSIPGVMHACGHDGHTAMALGAARLLADTRNFDGKAVFVFQPAEEGGAGSPAMLQDGLMERFGIQEIYGLHNTPGLPIGRFAIRSGPIMAAGDRFTITLRGKGGHAAHPESCVDIVLTSAQIVVALQSIISRNVDALDSAVLSVCSIQSGNTFSVLPETATLLGTVRTFTPETQAIIETRIRAIAAATAEAYGATATVDYDRRVPATVNHPEQTAFLAEVAGQIGEVENDTPPHMGGEDFSYMLQARPGAFIFLGNGPSADLHNPGYDFDDNAIPYGIALWSRVVEQRMPLG